MFVYSSLRPVVLEPFEPVDDADGYPEKNLPKKSPEYYKNREVTKVNIIKFLTLQII